MALKRECQGVNERGERCGQAPLTGKDFCYWHDPENANAAAEARRAGGMNRRKEETLQVIYDFPGIDDPEQIKRLAEIGIYGLLANENTVQRNRAILGAAMAAMKILEISELGKRVQQLETLLDERLPKPSEKRKRWGLL